MKNRKRILKRITAIALAIMMVGTTVDVSALTAFAAEDVAEVTCNHVCDETCGGTQAVTGSALTVCNHVHDENCGYEEAEAECTCGTDDPAFHATNCPAYIAPENPQCYCAEKCTEDTLNIWCDVCGVQGVSACQGEDTAVAYEIVASGTCGAEGNESSVTWSLDSDGTLTISGSGAMADYEQVETYPIHYTTPWHDTDNDGEYQNSNIKKVVVEEGITHIGNAAFRDFTELTSISIPNTVKSIGYRSVSYCWKLESLVIPDSVTSIGKEAFDYNVMLTSVTIGNNVESIGAYAFSYAGVSAGSTFTITLPKSVTSIDSKAFSEIYKGATIRYSCSYNAGNGYSAESTKATLEQYHLCEYSSSGNEINCSGCTCGEYSSSTATLSLSSDEPIYYTGEEIKPAVTVNYPDDWVGDEIEPSENNCTYSFNINAGTATCTFKYAEGVEASLDFTIEKVDSVITAAPTPADLVYDGTALNLINAGTTTDGEMQYSLDGTNYSSAIPTGTDAKTYTVWYKVVGDENHNDTEPEKVEVSIAKGTPDIGTVSASNLENTLDVSEVVLSRSNETVPGTFSLAEGTILQYGIHDYTYVFTPNDNINYETVTGTVSVTITDTNAPTATYKVGTDGWKQFINTITFGHFCKDYTTVDITYSDEESGVADKQYYISEEEITNTENIQWSEYTDTLNINATGKYYIYVRATDNYGNVVIQNSEGIVVYAESVIAPTSFSCEYGEENSLHVDISTNGNTFANLTDGSGNEIATENYSTDGSTLTIKGEYLSDLDVGEYTYKICMNPLGVENTEATLAYSFVVKVTAKELTVTGATATSRDYIANDKTVDITGVTLSGKQGTDDVSVEITVLKGTLSSANAGTYTSVTLPTLTLTGDDAENYVLVQPTSAVATDVTINKATPPALTIPTATTITYGEKLSASTLSDSSWAWVDGTIVPNASDYYNAYIEVDDSNYDYTGVYGYDDVNHRVVRGVAVIISRATLTITANSYTIKVGEALPTYEYTVTGLVGDDTLPVDVTVSCSAADSNAVDTYPITISGVVSDNILASHYVINYVDGTLTISEKDTQEITADDITLTYGETGKKISATTNGDGAITYTVATGTDVISVAADGTITVLKAGTATVTIRAAETADYAEATKTISVTVNKKKVAVPAVDTNGYIYTGTAQTYGVTSTDDYTVEGGVQTNAGEYPVTITLNNENYEWDGTLGTYEFVINKVAITVTAKNYSIKVSETLPTYAYEVAGLVNGETLPIDVAISCNATNSNTAGTYTIIVSGAANSANYLFTYVNGTLIVSNKEEQTITASDVTLTYGETGKKISATTNGDGAITYTVATGTDVISVAADGTITVLKAGTATVTIRAAETADYAEAIKTISVTVSACSHRYTSKVTKQPSYTEKGERTYTCNCGHSYTEEIPKLQPSSGGNNGGGGGTSGSGTPEPTATPIPTATPKPTVTPKPTPAPEKLPHIQDEDGKSGWDVIGDEIEKVIEDAKDSEEKAVVTVDMNGVTKVPKDIFEQIAGKDVSVEFILDNGLMWTVNGKTVNTEELKEIDFAVTVESEENPIDSIPVKVINLVTGERSSVALQLAHSGEFGFEAVLTVDLEEKNAGLYANLFFYNEDAEELEFICADVIAKDGTADLTFTHASDYLIVLSETSMEPKEEGKEPEVKEPVLMKGYTVQIGAFSSEANAKKWEQKGEAINIPMFIIKDGKLFKVQTDVFETGEEAAEASKKLAAAGLTNFILKTERLVTPEGEETPEVPTKPTKPETPALPENPEKKSIEDLAKEVIAGKWGNGTDRKDRLTKAGYDYKEVQNKVNELLQ